MYISVENVCLRGLPCPLAAPALPLKTLEITKLNRMKHSRSILVASVEDHERVRLAEEIFLVQFVGTELHSGAVLQGSMEMWGEKCEKGFGGKGIS